MLIYIIRRLVLMIPTLIGVTVLVFFIMAYAPGGFSAALDEGSQGMGVEARRIKQEVTNRYALDQPKIVQYGRWLNQVSPIGFKMSDDYKWTDTQKSELDQALGDRTWVRTDGDRKSYHDLILTISAFSGLEPSAVLEKFDNAAQDPVATYDEQADQYTGPAAELFELLDAKPLEKEKFWAGIAEKAESDKPAAVGELFREVGFSSINKTRVMFGSVKFWDPDLGTDRSNRNVGDLIAERLPITLLMNLITLPLIYFVSIVVGVLAARKRGGAFDVWSGALMLGLYSVPVIFAGVLAISYLANAEYLRWFPAAGVHDLQADTMPFLPYAKDGAWHPGWLLDFIWHLILPIACLTYGGFAYLTKVMRGSVLETISADFVRTARAKGVAEKHILFRHVLRNSMLPLITMAAAILPGLFVGSFVVEVIFSIQGMGLLTVEAAKNADVNIVMATTLVGSVLSLFSLLLRDILYAVADPRVTYD